MFKRIKQLWDKLFKSMKTTNLIDMPVQIQLGYHVGQEVRCIDTNISQRQRTAKYIDGETGREKHGITMVRLSPRVYIVRGVRIYPNGEIGLLLVGVYNPIYFFKREQYHDEPTYSSKRFKTKEQLIEESKSIAIDLFGHVGQITLSPPQKYRHRMSRTGNSKRGRKL